MSSLAGMPMQVPAYAKGSGVILAEVQVREADRPLPRLFRNMSLGLVDEREMGPGGIAVAIQAARCEAVSE